ncbi:hypothetical protein Tco_1516704 [Tanacetum coccineum]
MEKKSVIARLNKVSSPDGDYLVIYRANGNFRAFNYLMKVLHIFYRQDLFHLYDLMREKYSEVRLDGFALILWGDLKIINLCKDALSWFGSEKRKFVALDLIRCIKEQINEECDVNGIEKVARIYSVWDSHMGFNESGEYKETFIGSGVVGSQEVQTQDLIYYHPTRDREQHSAWELFSYREDSNEAAFAVAAVDKIYAHESLTFNNTVACEVISKWKAGLKDDMDARSDVYVLSNGCKKCSDDSDGYYWEYTPGMFIHLFLYIDDMVFSCGCKAEIWATKGLLDKAKGNVLGMEIVRDQSGNTLRVSQSRFYNEKLVQTLLEGHSILSLEGSLSGDCDVEKNGKWSCIYAVGSQEYQMVCTRLDIASADVGMLDKFDRGLQTDVQVFVDFDYAMAGYMTLTEAAKEVIWLKGLAIESGFELKIVAGIATGALSKAIPGSRF